jgi:metal-sulfur cluster biosynthetic enzyme
MAATETGADPGSPYPYAGPAQLRDPIDRALRRVVDPEVAMTIVDVGIVYGVTVAGNVVHVVMTMTSAACPVADVVLGDVETELYRALPAPLEVRVELVWEPPWTIDRMSPRARAFMGW